MRRDRGLANEERGLLAELEAVYREVDATYAGWSCPASTECCRFAVTGREPYVTSIELAAVRRAVAARGGAKTLGSVEKRGLPVAERPCPLLTAEGRCAVYAARPLGCRTFFCGRAEPGGPVRRADVAAFVRAVQGIAARHTAGGDQGRPLTRAL